MSQKKGDLSLLIPGADTWEIWKSTAENQFDLHATTEATQALDVTGFPSGRLAMAIPVRQVTSVPFRAQTTDLTLLADLAAMQLEQNGSRPALDGGQLSDHFVYQSRPDETILTAVVLIPPTEGQLPRKSPQAFDLSAHCFQMPLHHVAVWRELGRWVFAIGEQNKVLYFQCLSSSRLDDRAGNEIRLALTQLQIQGLLTETPTEVVVWKHDSPTDARPEEIESLAQGLGISTISLDKPNPTFPSPPSRLLPADVRAERLAQKNRQNRNLIIAAALVLYLGLAAYLYYGLDQAKKETTLAQNKLIGISQEADVLIKHRNQWAELQPVVESQFHPFEILLHTYRSLPNEQRERVIRLKRATMINQFRQVEGELQIDRRVVLEGQADEAFQAKIPIFAGNLRSNPDLDAFQWSTPAETLDNKTGKMTFIYEGTANP